MLAWLLLAAHAAPPTFTGPQFVNLSRSTIDLMRAQHYRIQGQLAYDECPFFMEGTVRAAPGIRFVNWNGDTLRGGLERLGGGYWGGWGHPRTGVAFFLTGQMDGAIALVQNAGGNDVLLLDGLFMTGLAVHGFSFQAGIQGGVSIGLDPSSQFAMRDFTTGGGGDGDRAARPEPGGFVFSAEHAEGLSAGAVVGRLLGVDGEPVTSLAAARTLFQPAALLERADLRRLGAPALGLDVLAPEVDYYGDGLPRDEASWEVPIVIDDLAETGIRVRAVPQVAPLPLFRLAELGWAAKSESAQFAVSLQAFRRADRFVPSAEALLGGTFGNRDNRSDEGKGPMTVSLSYSYNVPDSVTFFPIPDSHVVGFQYTVGPPSFARPLVPMVAHQDEDPL